MDVIRSDGPSPPGNRRVQTFRHVGPHGADFWITVSREAGGGIVSETRRCDDAVDAQLRHSRAVATWQQPGDL